MAVNLGFNPQNAGLAAGLSARSLAQQQYAATAQTATANDSAATANADRVQISSEASARAPEAGAQSTRLADQYLSSMQDMISLMQEQVQGLQTLTSPAATGSQSLAELGTADQVVNDEASTAAANDGNLPSAFAAAANASAESDLAASQRDASAQEPVSAAESQNLAQLGTADLTVQDEEATEAANDGDLPASFNDLSNADARSESQTSTGNGQTDSIQGRLDTIASASGVITRNQEAMAASDSSPAGNFSLSVDLNSLGTVDAGNGNTVSLNDLSTLTGPQGDSNLAAAVVEKAAADLAAAGTEIENYRSMLGGNNENISGAEELLNTDTAGALTAQTAQNITAYDPAALIQAAAGNISGARAVDLLS